MRAFLLACAAFLTCATLRAADLGAGSLTAFDTPHYTLVTDVPALAGELHGRVGKFERVLTRMLAREMEPTGTPTFFYLVNGALWRRYLQPVDGIVGAFVPGRFSNYLLVNADAGAARLPHDVQHEFTHLFLRTQFRGEYPLWFDEGMAELMEHVTLGKNNARFEIPARHPSTPWIPFARLVGLSRLSPEYLSMTTTEAVHIQSWALLHMGFVAEPDFGAGILQYIEEINQGVFGREAVENSFGMNTDQVDAKLREYLARRKFPVAELEYDAPTEAPLGTGRLLGRGDANVWLARALLDTGINPRRVRELVNVAASASPGSPAVGVLEMRLAARTGDDAALERHYHSVMEALPESPAASSDVTLARGAGLALFERVRDESATNTLPADKRTEYSRRAFALLDRTLTALPGDGEATWAYALLAARLGENLESALSRLELARARVRDNSDLAMAMALVHEARGEFEPMVPLLEEAARYADSAEKRAVVNSRIAEIRRRMSEFAPL
jgi:hypothetical protein